MKKGISTCNQDSDSTPSSSPFNDGVLPMQMAEKNSENRRELYGTDI